MSWVIASKSNAGFQPQSLRASESSMLFGQLSAEAEDDFHQVFGRAFLQAYEEQLDRLHNQEAGGGT